MTKKIQQTLIIISMSIILLGIGYFNFLLKPLNHKYNVVTEELNRVQEKLRTTKMRALELPKLQKEMKLLELEVSLLEKLLPKDKDLPDLLRTLVKTAQQYGLNISLISPAKVKQLTNYNEVPFKITLSGNYHDLAHFFTDLGQEPRILTVRQLVIKSRPFKKGDSANINVNFEIVAYTFKS